MNFVVNEIFVIILVCKVILEFLEVYVFDVFIVNNGIDMLSY